MMRISCKVEYGIRALLDLALHGNGGPSLSRDTAQRQGIPETYLNQLLIQLRRGGLIASVRGPRGGHMLAQPAESITVLHILEALEGPLVVVPEGLPESMSVETDAILSSLWDELRTTMEAHLSAVTLQDLAERAQLRSGELMYEI
ncbi:MAG TPA: Rrf2 family transcriptional regulator [Herpetosiphonaceae bacterium]|jgi:Rrf2 family protein|nr:Rrf2 family transcriptional regulator [Herpetosiphonaceae bacterium]